MRIVTELGYWIALSASLFGVVWFGTEQEGVGLLLYAWAITLPIVLNLILAAALSAVRFITMRPKRMRFVFVPLICTGAMVVYGVLCESNMSTAPSYAVLPLYGLLGLQVIIVLTHAIVTKGFRWLSVSIGLLSLWLSCSVGFVAAMMVTGDWI